MNRSLAIAMLTASFAALAPAQGAVRVTRTIDPAKPAAGPDLQHELAQLRAELREVRELLRQVAAEPSPARPGNEPKAEARATEPRQRLRGIATTTGERFEVTPLITRVADGTVVVAPENLRIVVGPKDPVRGTGTRAASVEGQTRAAGEAPVRVRRMLLGAPTAATPPSTPATAPKAGGCGCTCSCCQQHDSAIVVTRDQAPALTRFRARAMDGARAFVLRTDGDRNCSPARRWIRTTPVPPAAADAPAAAAPKKAAKAPKAPKAPTAPREKKGQRVEGSDRAKLISV